MCAECHSTRVRKNYDRFSEQYDTTWTEIDVSCEACHGPGSEHVRWAEAADRGQQIETSGYLGLVLRLKDDDGGTWVFRDTEKGTAERSVPRQAQTVVETCARCHARRTNIHQEYVHGRSFMDTHWPSLLEEQLYYPDGQIYDEVYVYGSFLQSKMYMAGVSCRDCHEPHSARVFAQGNALCFRCHMPEKYGGHSHHFHKDESTGALCVECHMRERTYMVVDPRRDHSMRVPRPDLADRRGYPEARGGLLSLANDSQAPLMVRATALSLLPQYPFNQTLEALKRAAYDNDPLIRMTAVQGFEMLGAEERVPHIKHLLRDPVRLVRVRAAFMLGGAPPGSLTSEERRWLASAVEEYRQVQHFNADHPTAHLNLGVLAALEGNQEAAEASYRKALEMEPMLPFTYINLADLYRTQGREADGEKILRKGIDLNPDVADLHHALGLLYVREENIRQALSSLKNAAEMGPENSRFSYVYGVALNSQGRSQEALTVLEQALERHPFDRDLLYALATMNRDLGRFEDALKYASRLVEIYPDVPCIYYVYTSSGHEDACSEMGEQPGNSDPQTVC
jgi:tetratricopeptide (TPR) repeat protein